MRVPDLAPAALSLRLFGPFDARLHGAPLARRRSRKGEWLLALLVFRHGRPVERAWLAGMLWPESPPGPALALMRRELTDLRRALGSEAGRLHAPTSRTLCLDLTGADVDLVAFDQAVAQGDPTALERAVALYRGPLLEGCEEEWAFQERQVREQAYLRALETLAAAARDRGELGVAEQHLRRMVAVDPLREKAQRVLMQTLADGGNYTAATEVYRELRLLLHRELNGVPDAETEALFQQLRAEARRQAQAPRRSPMPSASNGAQPQAAESDCLLPQGTVTFLFTDIENSTRLWGQHPEAMDAALVRHDALAAAIIRQHDGVLVKQRGEGDSLFAVFARATDAVASAVELQRALCSEPWPAEIPLRVRVALHTGEATLRDGDYFGTAVNRCARLRAIAHAGQVLLSTVTEELVRETLPEGASLRDLGLTRLQDLAHPEHVFQLAHPDLHGEFPPLRSLDTLPNNLPRQLTSFIGRERNMAAVKELLSGTSLLTLTGSGGCGKTRLALQVAAEVLPEYPDGVWLVELAPLADPALVSQAVATVLGVREEPGRPLTATLAEYLRGKQVLLILDNCEHLLSACAQLADALLRSCPRLRMLASSREGLGTGGEQTYRVPSLSLPDPAHLPPLERLHAFEAVQLFADRARLSEATFAVTPANAPSVAQVCQRLDGIPLAIELAAARVKVLSVEQLNERLDDRFRLLTGGSRTALPRQQTLRALIDWSYDLLSPSEGALLRRLSVFAGGWTLEAAEAVCAGEGIEAWEVLDLLTSLVEKSMVLYEGAPAAGWSGGEGRYRLLETVRQYARDRLLEAGEGGAVRERHRDWCLALAEEAEKRLHGASQSVWLDRLEREHDNMRAALVWLEAHGEGEAGLRLGGALHGFWQVRGYWTEGREHLAGLLALPETEAPTAARAKAVDAAGQLAHIQGDHRAARAFFEMRLAICRELGDKSGIAWSLGLLGIVARAQGEHGAARALWEESLAIFRELGVKWGIARSLVELGQSAHDQGDYGAAQVLLEESLAIFRELGNKPGIVDSLISLAGVAQAQGDDEKARALYEEALPLAREVEDKVQLMHMLGAIGHGARQQGDYGRARVLYQESLALRQEARNTHAIAQSLEDFAGLAGRQQEWEPAARLLGAAEAVCAELGTALPVAVPAEYWRTVRGGRCALGEEAFAAAWAAGRAMSLDEAVALALEDPGAGGT